MTAIEIHSGSLEHAAVEVPGFRVTLSRFPAGMASRVHAHPRAVLAVTLTGRFEHRTPGEEADCPAASAHVKPVGEPHANRVGSVPSRVVSVEPDPGAIDRLGAARAVFERRGIVPDPEIGDLAWRLAAEIDRPDDVSALAAEGLVLEMTARAARAGERDGRPRPAWLASVIEILHERFGETLRIADLAEEVDVDARELAGRFREHLHVPIGTYVRRLRLEKAREGLASTEDPIASVAARSGYSDQSHLTRAMRKALGVTPGEYRRAASGR